MIKHSSPVLCSALLFLLVFGCANLHYASSGRETAEWYEHAMAYLKANERVEAVGTQHSEDTWKYLSNANEAKNKFLLSTQPSAAEIISYLRSGSSVNRKVALAAMSLKPIDDKTVVKELVNALGDKDRDSRIYASRALKNMSPESYVIHENEIYGHTLNEKDEVVLMSEILILGILNDARYFPVLLDFLQSQSVTLKLSAYNAVSVMGQQYIERAVNLLQSKGDAQTIQFIRELESGERTPSKYRPYKRLREK